jgi:TonB family protein
VWLNAQFGGNESVVGGNTSTRTLFSALLAVSTCVSLAGQAQSASGDQPQHNVSKDSLKIQVESTSNNAFKLLPKFNTEKDTAGFKLLPKHYDDMGVNDADFVLYDKEPQIEKKVEPKYPERAKRARLEGKVILKMWVDEEGKVKQVVVLKSDAEVFNEPAIEAAKQFVFSPAYMDKKPVAAWVSYPFRFQLPDTK